MQTPIKYQESVVIFENLSKMEFISDEQRDVYYTSLVNNVSFLYSLSFSNLGGVILNQKNYVFFMEAIHG